MSTFLSNPAAFVAVYLALMLPTYVLPYFGSNSVISQLLGAALATGAGVPPLGFVFFLLHASCLIALMYCTYQRALTGGKVWLVVFPTLAAVFDLMPILSWIPLVPTVMHLLAIILSVAGARETSPARQAVV